MSAYIANNKDSQVTQESDEKTPDSTPKASLASPVAVTDIVPQADNEVNDQFSDRNDAQEAEQDYDGNPLSEEQAKYFENSKVRLDEDGEYWDGDGKLVPVYHSTDADFSQFSSAYLGQNTDGNADDFMAATAHLGFCFNTQDITKSGRLGDRTIKAYLNAKRLYHAGKLQGLASDIWDYAGEEATPKEAGEWFAEFLQQKRYDGIVVNDEEFGGITFIVFSPNQIKAVENKKPSECVVHLRTVS